MSEAASGDLRVHGQRAEQRDKDEDDRCNRRHRACSQQRDAWLISERREVVHAREPDHLSPRMGADCRSLVILQRLAPCQPPSDGGLVLERLFLFHLLAKRNARRVLAWALIQRRRSNGLGVLRHGEVGYVPTRCRGSLDVTR